MQLNICCNACLKDVITIRGLPVDYDTEYLHDSVFKGIVFCEECKWKAKDGFSLTAEKLGK